MVKKCTDMPFSMYLQIKRCKKAAYLLANTDISISKIINFVGYENESFFRKIFYARYGKKPLEYRKSNSR